MLECAHRDNDGFDIGRNSECCRTYAIPINHAPLCVFQREADEVVRFHWRFSFGGGAVITAIATNIGATLEWTRYHFMEDNSHGARPLARSEWGSVEEATAVFDLYRAPEYPYPNHQGLDGSTWTIEGRRAETYNRATSWSPPAGPFRELGLQLAILAGLRQLIEPR